MKSKDIYYLKKYDNKILKALGICNILKICKENNNLYLEHFKQRIIKEINEVLKLCKNSTSFTGEVEFYNKSRELWSNNIKSTNLIQLINDGINNCTLFAININAKVSKKHFKKIQEFSLNCAFVNLWVNLNNDEQNIVSCRVLEGFEDCVTCNVRECKDCDIPDSERIFYSDDKIFLFNRTEYEEILQELLMIEKRMYIRYKTNDNIKYGSVFYMYEDFANIVHKIRYSKYCNDKTLLKVCNLIYCLYKEIVNERQKGKDSYHYILRNVNKYNFKTIYEYKWLSKYLKLHIFKKMGLLVNNLNLD